MKIKHIVSCFFVSLIGLSACSIEELPYNQLTEDELDGSYESLLSATRGNYAVFKQTAFHQGWHYAGELASDNVSLSGVSSDALMYIYNYQRIPDIIERIFTQYYCQCDSHDFQPSYEYLEISPQEL